MADSKDEYTVEFKSDPEKLDSVDWKSCEVKAFVRPFSGAALVPVGIDSIVEVRDDSDGLLKRGPASVVDKYFVNFDVNIDRDKLNQLDENAAPSEVSIRVKIDASKNVLGPAMIPVPGFAQALTTNTAKDVVGKVKLKVEFPPPYIWHPYLPEHSASKKTVAVASMNQNGQPTESQNFLLLDSQSKEVTSCKLELRKFSPAKYKDGESGYIAVEDELLQLELKAVFDECKEAIQIKEIKPQEVLLATKRLIIGKDEEPIGTLDLKRQADKKPAKNEPATIDVKVKGYEVELAIKLLATNSGREPFTIIRKVRAEGLKLYWTQLNAGAAGRVPWKILNELPRMQESGFKNLREGHRGTGGFRPVGLSAVDTPDGKKIGVQLDLVELPITKDTVKLDGEPDNKGAELEFEETLKWSERPAHWPAEISGPEAFRALGTAIATEKRFKSKFCDIERAQYVFDRMRKAAAVYQLRVNRDSVEGTTQGLYRPDYLGQAGGSLTGIFAGAKIGAPFGLPGAAIGIVVGGVGGYLLGEKAGEQYEASFGDPENCGSLKQGLGSRGNCGEWSYAFQSVLTGAGMGQTEAVYATPDPTPDAPPASTRLEKSSDYTGTDTALLITDAYAEATRTVNVKRIFDIFRQLLHNEENDPNIVSDWANCPPTDGEVNRSFGPQKSWLGGKLGRDNKGKMEKSYIKNINHKVIYTVPGAPPPPPSVDRD